MAVLVTRPQPDNDTTAAALRARGYDVVAAPMLRFEPLTLSETPETKYAGVIVTSAAAIRALEGQAALAGLRPLRLYAVGAHTAEAAREAGFSNVVSADGDAAALRELILGGSRKRAKVADAPLLYLAGADLARDLASELGERGFTVAVQTTYRMTPATVLPPAAADAVGAGRIEAVLHYSRRSARAFAAAARASGVEVSALAILQCCLSEAIAMVIRDGGADHVAVARTPDENALFETLDRAIRARSE
jgi:uroporphyrinogen-III synthase